MDALARTRLGVRVARPRQVVRCQGDDPETVFTVIDGWAAAYHTLLDGRRHITRFLTAGSLIDAEPMGLPHAIETVEAITETTLCVQSGPALDALRLRLPALEARFVWLLERALASDIETATALAQLTAVERLAHILEGLVVRVLKRFPVDGDCIDLPLTQAHLGDATGLTAVHVNRSLRRLRQSGVLSLSHGKLTVLSAARLEALAAHDPAVLALYCEPLVRGPLGPIPGPDPALVRSV